MKEYNNYNAKPAAIPLHEVKNNVHNIDPIGTGTLIKYNNRHFLCTAGHVLGPQSSRVLGVGKCYPPLILANQFERSTFSENAINDDDIDFAAAPLLFNEINILQQRFRFDEVNQEPLQTCAKNDKSLSLLRGYLIAHNEQIPSPCLLDIVCDTDRQHIIHSHVVSKDLKEQLLGAKYVPKNNENHLVDGSPFKSLRHFNGFSGGAWYHICCSTPLPNPRFAGIVQEAKTDVKGKISFTGLRLNSIIKKLDEWFPKE